MMEVIPTYEDKYMYVENSPNTVNFRVYWGNATGKYYYNDGETNQCKYIKYNLKQIKLRNRNIMEEFIHKRLNVEEKSEFIFTVFYI